MDYWMTINKGGQIKSTQARALETQELSTTAEMTPCMSLMCYVCSNIKLENTKDDHWIWGFRRVIGINLI